MNIQQIRAQYPQYEDLNDQQLADLLRKRFYPDLEPEDFYKRIGFEGPQGGFVPAFKAGAQRLIGQGALTLGKAGVLDTAEAERINQEREARARQIFQPTQESFVEAPLQNLKELAGGSAPYMLAPLAVGAGAALGGAPAAVGLGAAGLTSFGQFVGSNLGRQVDEGKTLEQASGTQAVAAAVPQALLDVVGFRFIPGIGKLFGAAGERVTAETAKQLAEQTAKKVAADYAQATGKAMTVEGLTEATQQALERAQAELQLMDPEARKEYLDSFFGGAVLGGALAVPGRAVERAQMSSQSRQMQGEQERVAADQQALRQRQEQAAQQTRMATEANPREMGPQLQGSAQQMIPGVDAYAPPQAPVSAEEQLVELRREQEQLRTLVRNSDDLYRMERDRLQRGQFDGPSAVQQVQQAQKRLKEIDAELAKRGIQAYDAQGSVAQRLRKAQEELQALAKADENSYDPEQVDKLKRRIEKLRAEAQSDGGAQDTLAPDLFGTIDVNERTVGRDVSRNLADYNTRVYGEREGLLQQQQVTPDDEAAQRLRDATAEADEMRYRGNQQAELDQIERAAAGTAEAVEQPRLFGEPEGIDRVGTGTAGTARSEAQILADIEIAKASRERDRVNDLVSELRALRDANRTREADAKTKQADASQLGDRALERTAGMQLPAETARRQAATDARYRAFGQMVSAVDRVNKGRADADTLRTAERQVADNLVAEIESLRGSPLTPAERSDVLRELRPLLEDLKSRFGDTRTLVNTGSRKEPEMEPVQNMRGDFRRDLPGTGAGPTGMGLENQESRRPGDRTFSSRYAAAQSILEGIDQIRNRMAGQQESAPGVDRNDSTRPVEQRLDDALRSAQARATPAQRQLLDQLDENRDTLMRSRGTEEQALPPSRAGRVPQRLVESAIEFGNRVARGQDTTDLERELQDGLRGIAQAQETETETLLERRGRELSPQERVAFKGTSMEGRTTAMGIEPVANLNEGPLEPRGVTRTGRQGDLFGDRGTIFNSYAELEAYLASDALDAIKMANGQTRETLARANRMVEPLRKKAAELEKRLQGLLAKKASRLELNDLERRVSDSQIADGEAAVAKANADLEFAVSEYREAVLEAQIKLQAALDEDARIAREIADNAELIKTQERFINEDRKQIRDAQTEVIGLSREIAKAKEALAKHAASLFSSADPLSRPKLAKYNELEANIAALQQKLIERSTRAAQLSGNPPSSDKLLEFQRRAAELVQQRRQQARSIGGLTSARNRAQKVLDQAQQAAMADPELSARLESAQSILATARSLQGNADANIAQRERRARALQPRIDTVGAELQRTRQQANERVREASARPAASPESALNEDRTGLSAREAADGQRRQAEQRTLETRQQGPGTDRETVSFERRRLDQESLNEANAAMETLEGILARVPMNAEERQRYDEAAAEYTARRDALEQKAQARLENVEGKLNAQRKRIAALQQAQADYAAAEVDSPERERAQNKVAKLTQEIRVQGEKISKAWGIERARVSDRAEKRRGDTALSDVQEVLARRAAARKARVKPETDSTPAGQTAVIAETQTRARTTSPATRETRGGGGMRTGNLETQEARAGAQRTRIVERTIPPTSRREVTAKEIAEANAIAQTVEESKKEAAAANAAAEQVRKQPKAKKAATVEKAAKAVEQTLKPKRTSRVQDAIDAADDGYGDDFEPALFREDNTYYEANKQTPVNDAMEDALEAGDVDGFLAEMEKNGSTPFHRSLAAALRPMVQNTRLRIEDVLIEDGKRVFGLYDPATNTISLDALGGVNEEVVLHELVHAATLRALRGQVQLNAEQRQALAELQALFEQVKNDPLFKREYAGKNFDEFVSELMTNTRVRDKINRIADGQSTLLQRIYNAILNFLGIKRQYGTQAGQQAVLNVARLFEPSQSFSGGGPAVASVMRGVFPATKPVYAQAPADISALAGKVVGRSPTLGQRIAANVTGLAFRTQFLDQYAPVQQLLDQGVAKGLIKDAQALQTSYFLRFGAQRNQFVSQAATAGVPQLMKDGDERIIQTPEGSRANLAKIGQVLSKAGVGNEQATEELFTTFLAVRRAEQVGYNKLNFDSDVTPADAKRLDDFLASRPEAKKAFEEARALYRQYNNDLLDLAEQLDAMSPATVKALKRGDYVPYYRAKAGGDVELMVDGERPIRIGNIKDQPYLQELVGGNDKILPFFAGALQNTSMLIDMALRNKQIKEVALTLQQLGASDIRQGAGPTNRNTIRFMINGEPVHVVVNDAVEAFGVSADLLVKGLEGIKTTLPAALKLLQIPTNILRAFITRSPAYALRQLIREPINAWLVSGANFTPVASSVKELAGVLRNTSEGARQLERTGAISSNVFTGDVQDNARILRDVQSGKTPWQSVLAAADKVAIASDTATRAVVYDRYRAQGLTHMQATLATLETMNFSRRGLSPTMQMMSMLVPFFNAQVQGLDVIYRAMSGKATLDERLDVQRKLMSRGLLIAAGTMAYAAMMQDDEAYKNANAQQRALNWFLPLPGTDEPLRVPIPFELGYLFKSIPEMVYNTAFGDMKAGEAAKALGSLAFQTVPIGLPQAIKPALEVVTNYSLFTDAPIESAREQGLQAKYRTRDNTSALAAALGTEFLSPVQIDYLIRGYTGGLGAALLGLTNAPMRLLSSQETPDLPTKRASEMPFVGALFQPADGRAAVDDAYETIQSWQQAHNTLQALVKQGKQAEARQFAQEFGKQVALNATGGAFRQQMGELAQVRRAVVASTTLTPEQKRAQVDQIRQLEIAMARKIRALGDRAS